MMVFIINTFSYDALLEQVRNGLNDVITNETLGINDFRMSVSNIGPKTDKHHHRVYCDCCQHEILFAALEEYKYIVGKESTLKNLIGKWKLVPESTLM